MPRGGYRRPGNPAPVSGPGKFSRRTDGGPQQGAKVAPGGKYGERKELMEQQQGAPMAAQQKVPNKAPGMDRKPLPLVPLTAPTQRPDEPISMGSPFGPGPGPEMLGFEKAQGKVSDVIGQLVGFDTTGELEELYNYLLDRGL